MENHAKLENVGKQFWILLAAGLAIVGAGLSILMIGTKGNHLELTGAVLHTRVLALNPKASIVIVDFRVKNPTDVPFVARSVTILLDPASGEELEGQSVSKPDVDNLFKYEKLLGPKFNDVLTIRDKIAPHQSLDRMAGARFELSDSAVDARKSIRVRIEDLDGTVAVISEKPAPK
jgi:hypothetical protein